MTTHWFRVYTNTDLVGVEILEESANAMTLQDLVGVADMDLRKTLTRMQRIARIMAEEHTPSPYWGAPPPAP